MTDLEHLKIVAQARYDQQRSAFAKILQDETRLRHELRRITNLGCQSRCQDQPDEMQVIGADILWRGWLGRSKTALNLELARVLARKENEQDRVRIAFGKLTALSTLSGQMKTAAHKKKTQVSLSEAIVATLQTNFDDQ